tara:strand:- start:109 stop:888 length:780 start_codon:yes stop_codon:yes gene_type:complete
MPCQYLHAKPQAWQKIEYIIQSFFEVGLGSEYGESDNNNLRKWRLPLRLYVEHQVGDEALHNKLLNAHIKQLTSITLLDIKRVSHKKNANIFYYFTRQSSLPKLVENNLGSAAVKYLHGSVCLANVKTDKFNYITSAHIFIPVDQARMHGKLVACIVEELTQVLGLIRDSDLVYPSIFNDKTHNSLLTGLDEILLRLLSEDDIKADMSEKQLRPILLRLLKRYETTGLIDTADERIQQGELYEILGFRRSSPTSSSVVK